MFISYVHDNDPQVDRLCAILAAAQIPHWRDESSLAPGDNWRAEIRRVIREGLLVLLACFSAESRARSKSYIRTRNLLSPWRSFVSSHPVTSG